MTTSYRFNRMELANLVGFMVGGIPICHGALGLAVHYRFGVRTAIPNLIIGLICLFLAVGSIVGLGLAYALKSNRLAV